MESCCDTENLIDNVLVILSTIQIVSDIMFAEELKKTHTSCAESCKSGETCSNGMPCPEDTGIFNSLYIASVVFISLSSLLQLYIASLPLFYQTEEKYIDEAKADSRKRNNLSESKKKLVVLINGDRIETFYLYQAPLPWSREAILQLYTQFDSKIQVLKGKTVLLPLYGHQ